MAGTITSGNPHPSGGWKKGEVSPKGARAKPGTSWKEIITKIMNEEPYEAWRDKYGHTWAEAIIRRGNELFMQGKLPNWFISIAQYTQPNQQQIDINLTDWTKFENLGIPKEAIIQRFKEMAQQAQIEIIDGESREVNELTVRRPDDVGGGSVSNQREASRQVSVDTDSETETSA